ncbi:hypothetical protein UA38_22495 [Photobacterium kishitanii]|uniref:Bacteriocin immunity protein n=1 Tax=Photobacterium kishitanii TaxID=318456 RepID=A0AAX0YTK9_9GAMM|nr:bacteriocin immunity protein [Photobacterium kishitanii]KJG53505.1 hypothetical protein UA38_22495 [Photobacterium kishitanii]KJG55988.1 hypothetical protein UA42_22710 [Photobacterium kishitanii]KJG62467.1 hypothetical protein UA40_22695 [Photobacterium kishitanii]KJG64572.1 hypothetical protein UA41_22700 [Photobacterium kishitanii]PSX18229.1 bacteriocin immunity protein [Photobacterium kishitanii]
MNFKKNIEEYSEFDFCNLLKYLNNAQEKEADEIMDWLDDNIKHPDGYGLITHPIECGIEDSPEAVIAELKRWYREQGLSLFKE